ncbi:MAG TPA: recombination-associated protein RdgC [Planctomycetota bacterium]|nr:recombination-associated protein RdgC [Planctomycetota bacterium]
MLRFRRSGSFTRFFVEGDPADVSDAGLLKALERDRFRPIDGSATDEESVGWITREDPAGARFRPDSVVTDRGLVFALRIDRKRVPATLLRIQAAADLRAAGAGKPLGRAARKEIVDEAKRKLVARALPNVAIVDCIWDCRGGVLLAFATSDGATDHVARQFRATFRRGLVRATASSVAERLRLPEPARRALVEASPLDLSPSRAREEVEA